MDLPTAVKGLMVVRAGVGLSAVAAPAVLAVAFGRPPAEARTPMAAVGISFFGIRELALAAVTAGATAAEPLGKRRLLLVCAATDGLDLAVLGLRAARQPGWRRAVLLFGPAAAISTFLHLCAAQKVEITP